MRVIVIGCGIGGMATAIGLRRAGIEHVVLEQAPALLPVGAGIQLSPNAVRVLEWLGIGARMAEFCVEPGAHLFRDWQGEPLLTTPLMPKVRETFGAPYYHAHRSDLLDAMVERLGMDSVRLDAKVARVAQDQNGVAVTLADGSVERGDVLIGADGIHSLVRETLFRPEPPRFSGNIAWRGLVPAEIAGRLGFERNSYIWMGPGRCMVLYYVSGGRLLNWIGLGETDGTTIESWSARGRTEDALAQFVGWHPQITGLIEATPAPYKFAIYDREPLSAWVDGRIALLGDAAHAMLPYHAQGAAQSIEDAWVLARCLEEGRADPAAALKHYESLRLDRANRVVEQSRAAADSYQLTEPAAVAKRNARLAKHQAVAGEFPPGQRWLFAYDAEKAVRGDDAGWRQTSW